MGDDRDIFNFGFFNIGDDRMKTENILNTGRLIAAPGFKFGLWSNPEDHAIRIHKTYLWIGIDIHVQCDAHLELRYNGEAAPIDILQWDHYSNPIQPVGRWTDHRGMFELAPGGELIMWYMSTGYGFGMHFYGAMHYESVQ